jgi:hypothetical protein
VTLHDGPPEIKSPTLWQYLLWRLVDHVPQSIQRRLPGYYEEPYDWSDCEFIPAGGAPTQSELYSDGEQDAAAS